MTSSRTRMFERTYVNQSVKVSESLSEVKLQSETESERKEKSEKSQKRKCKKSKSEHNINTKVRDNAVNPQ